VGLANLVLFIIVLVKLFQEKGVGHGILGIICSLYTFIWGWTKHKELQITNIMTAWSVLIVVSIILNVITQSQMAGGY
jgi:hypothetical protein